MYSESDEEEEIILEDDYSEDHTTEETASVTVRQESEDDDDLTPDDYATIYNRDAIYREEQEFLESDKETNKTYLGSVWLVSGNRYLMDKAIRPRTFFKYNIRSIDYYLFNRLNDQRYFNFAPSTKVEIMKLNIHPITGEYIVLLKTFWLRIVQRTWRRIMRERREIIKKRGSLQNIQYREIHGRYLQGLNVLPNAVGMIL